MQATISPQEFTDWFGSSQAVDALGQPLMLYHGTNAQFEQFNTSYIGQSQEGKLFAGSGFYFSDNKVDARAYGANVLSVHLRMQKTLDLRDKVEFLKAFADLIPRNQVKTLAQLAREYSEAKAALQIDDVMVKEEPHRPGFYDVQWKIAGEWQSSWPRTPSSLELSDDMTGRRYAERHALPPDPGQFLNTAAFSYADITKAILDNGYDGAINDASFGTCGDEYVVFSADQIMIIPVALKAAEQSLKQETPEEVLPKFSPKMVDEYGTGLRYDDGRVTGAIDVFDAQGTKGITIHEWSSRYPGHGHTKAALQWFREQGYERIVANGVGTLDLFDGASTGDVATAYWAHMHNSGLVDFLFDDEGNPLVVAPDETVTHQDVYLDGSAQAVNAQHGADSPLAQFGVTELHEQLVDVSRKLTWPSTDDRQYLKELHETKFELLLEMVSRQPESRPVEEVLALGRMAKLSSLKGKAGVSYTFYCLAQQAIDEAGGDLFKVDWTQVEDSTIQTSIGKNNQRPNQVHEALSQISPGAVSASRQEAILQASLATFEHTRNPEGKVSTN